ALSGAEATNHLIPMISVWVGGGHANPASRCRTDLHHTDFACWEPTADGRAITRALAEGPENVLTRRDVLYEVATSSKLAQNPLLRVSDGDVAGASTIRRSIERDRRVAPTGCIGEAWLGLAHQGRARARQGEHSADPRDKNPHMRSLSLLVACVNAPHHGPRCRGDHDPNRSPTARRTCWSSLSPPMPKSSSPSSGITK